VEVFSTTVSFRFAIPSSHQPRSDTPPIVQAVEVTDQGIVNGYEALGFPNNDPNTIPDSSLATIMDAVGIYSEAFFTNAVANLGSIAGFNADSVIDWPSASL
jgi:hypothetical protein